MPRKDGTEWAPPVWADDPNDSPYRCRAHAVSTGRRCIKTTVPGSGLCIIHGGAESDLTGIRRSVWLTELHGKALRAAAEMIDDEDPRVRLPAVKLLLDTIEVNEELQFLKDHNEITEQEWRDRLIRDAIRIRKGLGKEMPEGFKGNPELEQRWANLPEEEEWVPGPVEPPEPAALPEGPSTRDTLDLEDLI